MARKVITFYCELCNRSYHSEKDADACQASHLFPISVEKPEYDTSEIDQKKRYPESVLVYLEDSNGKKTSARYYRKH